MSETSKTIKIEPLAHQKSKDRSFWSITLFIFFVFLPIAGASFVWTKGLLFFSTGILYLLRPPKYAPQRLAIWAFSFFLLWQLITFLPLWSNAHNWLTGATDLGIEFPKTLASQPAQAIDGLIFLLGMAAWFVWVIDLELDSKIRQQLFSCFSLGLTFYAIIGILLGFLGINHPLADRAHVFTYFPNRNDYGAVLAIAGVISFALFLLHLRKGKDRSIAIFWLAANSIIVIALFKCISKSSFLIFFLACILWLYLLRKKEHLIYHFKLMAPAFLLLATALLTMGDRLIGRVYNSVSEFELLGLRLEIFKDSLACWLERPLTGFGLHSFKPIFRFFQDSSITENLITHPENDWLWWLIESGGIGFLCILLICYGLFRSLGKFHAEENTYSYRLLGLACLFAVFLQSFVNIPLHQPLIFMIVAFLFALSRSQGAWNGMPQIPRYLSRIIACFLIIAGISWVYSDWMDTNINSRNSFRHFENKALEAEKKGETENAFMYAEKAIRSEPINWQPYFFRASLYLRSTKDYRSAFDDFRRARKLSAWSSVAAFEEGLLWLQYNFKYTELAWAEALRREKTNQDELFMKMLSKGRPYAELYPSLERLSLGNTDWYVAYIEFLPSNKFDDFARAELDKASLFPHLTDSQRELLFKRIIQSKVFELYSKRLTSDLEKLKNEAIPSLFKAHLYASIGEYTLANDLVENTLKEEALPQISDNSSIQNLERQHKKNPRDIYTAVCLLNAYQENAMWNRAVRVLAILEKIDDSPDFVYYWKAIFLAKQGKSQEAWQSWSQYFSKKKL